MVTGAYRLQDGAGVLEREQLLFLYAKHDTVVLGNMTSKSMHATEQQATQKAHQDGLFFAKQCQLSFRRTRYGRSSIFGLAGQQSKNITSQMAPVLRVEDMEAVQVRALGRREMACVNKRWTR